MQKIDIVKFYKTLFKDQNLEPIISFQKFQEEVGSYIKQMGYDLDQEIAARLVAQRYKIKQYAKVQINQLSGFLGRNISVKGDLEFVSGMKTFTSKDKVTQYRYIMLSDVTGKARITFWQEDMDLLRSCKRNDNVIIYGYVTKSSKYGTLLRPEKIQILNSDSEIKTVSVTKLEELQENSKIADLEVHVIDSKESKKITRDNKELILYSYLLQDQTSMTILSCWAPLDLKVNQDIKLSNLQVGKFKQVLNLKPIGRLNIDIQKIKLSSQINISQYEFKNLTNLKKGLVYNVLLRISFY
jgi:RecG-like helicase